MKAYHNDPAIKAKYLARVRCAIGCTLESYNPSWSPIELGLPKWLVRLEEKVFNGLPASEAVAWPKAFLDAITPGADLDPVRDKLAVLRMDRLIELQNGNMGKYGNTVDTVITQTVEAIRAFRRCHEAWLDRIRQRSCDWDAAWSKAWLAREAAERAMWLAREAEKRAINSARLAVEAASEAAPFPGTSVGSAAWSARWSAAAAGIMKKWVTAGIEAYRQEADDLLRLLREAK